MQFGAIYLIHMDMSSSDFIWLGLFGFGYNESPDSINREGVQEYWSDFVVLVFCPLLDWRNNTSVSPVIYCHIQHSIMSLCALLLCDCVLIL